MLISEKRLWSYSKIWSLTLRGAVARGALKFFRLTRYHWCLFGPLNLANLWKAVNRIRLKMGKFSCTQVRTLTSSSPKKKKIFFQFLWGFFISCPHVLSAFWQNCHKNFLPIFVPSRARLWPNFGVIGGSKGFFWLKCSSSIADWSKKVASWCPQMKNKAPQIKRITFWPKS